jgi:nucleoside-diphosphate-sugar epimerase
MRILLTGGAGRLGCSICKTLLSEGLTVRIFDLDTPRNKRAARKLKGDVEFSWGDVTNPEQVKKAMDDVDMVVHMAAILPPLAYEQPDLARRVNVEGSRVIVDQIKGRGGHIPIIYTSTAAVFGPTPQAEEPLCAEKDEPCPDEVYGETKLQAENVIRSSGIDYLILRLSAVMYLTFGISDLKRMFTIPLDNRIEYCHPYDTALAIVNGVKDFDEVKGNTLVISGGPQQRMLYKDMIAKILGVMGLPLPPAEKFTKKPFYLSWYDTAKSQKLLKFQRKSFSEYLADYSKEISRYYSPLFIPFMRYFVSPLFGRLIVRLM